MTTCPPWRRSSSQAETLAESSRVRVEKRAPSTVSRDADIPPPWRQRQTMAFPVRERSLRRLTTTQKIEPLVFNLRHEILRILPYAIDTIYPWMLVCSSRHDVSFTRSIRCQPGEYGGWAWNYDHDDNSNVLQERLERSKLLARSTLVFSLVSQISEKPDTLGHVYTVMGFRSSWRDHWSCVIFDPNVSSSHNPGHDVSWSFISRLLHNFLPEVFSREMSWNVRGGSSLNCRRLPTSLFQRSIGPFCYLGPCVDMKLCLLSARGSLLKNKRDVSGDDIIRVFIKASEASRTDLYDAATPAHFLLSMLVPCDRSHGGSDCSDNRFLKLWTDDMLLGARSSSSP